MQKIYHLLTVLFLFTAAVSTSSAQLAVWPEPSDTNFIFSLSGPGITVENPVRNCHPDASGFFDASAASLDLMSGAIMTSGIIWDAPGPNASGSTSSVNSYPGDPDLDALPGILSVSYDACVIEFDMRVSSDTLKLDYIFGSEEYLEFAGSAFNDAFAFFLSGPGISGTVNIALVPGTSDPVSINSINSFTNPAFYVDNGDGFSLPYSADSTYVQFDGLTVRLTARHEVMPDSTYHMKLVVADVSDFIFDSGVFFATGALGSLRLGDSFVADGGGSALREGCGLGTMTFSRDPITADTLWLDLAYEGTADLDDFVDLPERVGILPGQSEADLMLETLLDSELEGTENLIIHLYNPQSGYIYRTFEIPVEDALEVDYSFTTAIELEAEFTASVPTGSSVTWFFGDGSSEEGTFVQHLYTLPGLYEVCMYAVDPDGCEWSTCKMVEITGSTGLGSPDQSLLSLYPNPATTTVYLGDEWSSAPVQVQVVDALGRTVLQDQLNQPVMDISELSPGVYFVIARQGDRYSRDRLLVE